MDSYVHIFRSLCFLKKSYSFVVRSKNEKISYTRARELIREALAKIGVDIRHFVFIVLDRVVLRPQQEIIFQIDFLKHMGDGNPI